MPRTKGALNKPKTREYLEQKLAELAGTPAKPEAKPKPEKIAKPEKAVPERTTFELENTNPNEAVPLDGQVLKCGNPVCAKIMDAEYSVCPFCGVNLQWQ